MDLRVAILACGVMGGLTSCHGSGAARGPDMKVASFRSEVVPVLRHHCAGCHTVGRPGAQRVPMFDVGGEVLYEALRPHYYHMLYTIDSGQMPKGRPGTVTPMEIRRLKAWWEAGMPDD